jgi:hypothetical protein
MIDREHHLQGRKVSDVTLERGETQCCEFHCALVRRDALERHGEFDEGLLATREHIDFSLTVLRAGGKLIFEPSAVVTYVFPNRANPLTPEDWRFFTLRWSPVWQRRSLEHFARKWGFEGEPYARRRGKMLSWRHNMAIGRPMARMIPLVARIPALERGAAAAATFGLRLWSRMLAVRHARRAPLRPLVAPLPSAFAPRPAAAADAG